MRIAALRNPVRGFAWGSRTALAEMLGQSVPSESPQAELWVGAHPSAPSEVNIDGIWAPLDRVLAECPREILGVPVSARFGDQLPLLLKVLAVAAPLSIQVHPGAERARTGFARETAAGIDAAQRCYSDANAKPEQVCALTDFEALVGLRPSGEIVAACERLAISEIDAAVARLKRRGDAVGLRAFCGTLLALRGKPEGAALVASLGRRIEADPDQPELALSAELLRHHPGDVACLAPFFLNHIALSPGESLFVEPGLPHSYLKGVAVEIMTNSDNVLRAGLTPKPLDLEEWLEVTRFELPPPPILTPTRRGAELVYESGAPHFLLSVLEPGNGMQVTRKGSSLGPELWLCVSGEVVIEDALERSRLALRGGQAALVTASVDDFQVSGEGRVFRARLPNTDAA